MKKRIFVGVTLSEDLQQEIVRWKEKHTDLPVRWTPLENLHVTLVPPWYEEHVDRIVSFLHAIQAPVKPFSVIFETVDLGPESGRPWLMWARGQMLPEFFTLQTNLISVLQRSIERKDPILHTTLARFSLEQFEQFPNKQFSERIRWEEMITSFSLIASHLRRTGAVYETLTTVQL